MEELPADIAKAFAYCAQVTSSHYENFSVLSFFIPKELRPHFAAVYAFCRGVDDLGDEFNGDRLQALDEWQAELEECYEGSPSHPVFRALQFTIQKFALEKADFLALIEANRIDQRVSGYETFSSLLNYCKCSANPVGHLVLQLFGFHDAGLQSLSDSTCTALQMTNFLQDISVDVQRGRMYLPQKDLCRFGVSQEQLRLQQFDSALAELMKFEVERTQALFETGKALETIVSGRLGKQLCLYRLGGEAILKSLRKAGYNPFPRPAVSKTAKGIIALKLLLNPWSMWR